MARARARHSDAACCNNLTADAAQCVRVIFARWRGDPDRYRALTCRCGCRALGKKNWLGARKPLSQALEIDKGCLPVVGAYGKLELVLHDREKAINFLMRAALMSSRVAIQKELGYLYLLDRAN